MIDVLGLQPEMCFENDCCGDFNLRKLVVTPIFEDYGGGMPERLKGADCKSAGLAYVGSNPTPPTIYLRNESCTVLDCECAEYMLREKAFSGGCSSMVEQ